MIYKNDSEGIEVAFKCEMVKARCSLDLIKGANDLDMALEYYARLCRSASNLFELKRSELAIKKFCNDADSV